MEKLPGCNYTDCQENINYLPFKCKYCGKIFCTKHRLPENHDCEGIKLAKESAAPLVNMNVPKITKALEENGEDGSQYYDLQTLEQIRSENTRGRRYNKDEEEKEKEQAQYRRSRIDNKDSRNRPRRFSGPDIRLYKERRGPEFIPNGKMTFTYYLMVLYLIFFFLSIIDELGRYIYLNSTLFFRDGFIWPLFTSMFIVNDTISILFRMIILYFFGRSVELRYGPKLMGMLFFLSGLICGLVAVIAQFVFQLTIDPTIGSYLITSSGGMFIGFITFFVLLFGPNTEMQFFFYFFPIRLKAKYIFYIVVGIEILMIIIGLFGALWMVAESLGNLSAVIAGIIMFKQLIR